MAGLWMRSDSTDLLSACTNQSRLLGFKMLIITCYWCSCLDMPHMQAWQQTIFAHWWNT